jgi:hypothetical protein
VSDWRVLLNNRTAGYVGGASPSYPDIQAANDGKADGFRRHLTPPAAITPNAGKTPDSQDSAGARWDAGHAADTR